MKKRLRFRRQERDKGLAGVIQGERGWDLMYGDERIAGIHPKTNGINRYNAIGWWWSCPKNEALGIEWRNTCNSPVDTPEKAKEECMAYVRQRIASMEVEKK